MLGRIARDVGAAIHRRVLAHGHAVDFEDLKARDDPVGFKFLALHPCDEDTILDQVDPEGKVGLHALGELLWHENVGMSVLEERTHLLEKTVVLIRARRRADLRNEVDVRLVPIEVGNRREMREDDLHFHPEPAEAGDLCVLAEVFLKRNTPCRGAPPNNAVALEALLAGRLPGVLSESVAREKQGKTERRSERRAHGGTSAVRSFNSALE